MSSMSAQYETQSPGDVSLYIIVLGVDLDDCAATEEFEVEQVYYSKTASHLPLQPHDAVLVIPVRNKSKVHATLCTIPLFNDGFAVTCEYANSFLREHGNGNTAEYLMMLARQVTGPMSFAFQEGHPCYHRDDVVAGVGPECPPPGVTLRLVDYYGVTWESYRGTTWERVG